MIPVSNPKAQYLSNRHEIDEAIHRVLQSGRYILGEEVAAFEREFADYCGTAHGVGVASGTDALTLALRGLGVGPGDEVVTVSHTAVATVAAIERSGASPVLIDVKADTLTMDPDQLSAAFTSSTKAVVPVHLYGQPADMDAIMTIARASGVPVVEDCAQAVGATYHGQRVGSIGDAGCFSFYPTKNLGAIGDGGMVVTNNADVAERVRLLRQYGWDEARVSTINGFNSRLDELQAAILRVKLRRLDDDNARRRKVASSYEQAFAGLPLSVPGKMQNTQPVFHLYVVSAPRREELRTHLTKCGVGSAIHYAKPVHLQDAYRESPCAGTLANTERACNEILSLPIYPEMETEAIATVSAAIKDFYTT